MKLNKALLVKMAASHLREDPWGHLVAYDPQYGI
jgi:hypothetical protein